MAADELLKTSSILQVLLCAALLTAFIYRRTVREFAAFSCLVALEGTVQLISTSLLFYRSPLHISLQVAYRTYYYVTWMSQIVYLFLTVLVIYSVFSEGMRPFPGIKRVGQVVFRWVSAVSLVVAIALATGPDFFTKGITTAEAFAGLMARLEQGLNVLILCLLIFVSFSIRPLGLTFRSRIFGVVLGLAIISTDQLVQCAWVANTGSQSLYSPVYAFGMMGWCVAVAVWLAYFALPEPKRRMILLPTTSPFFHWNRISEILGDAPGSVAIAGFTPDMLSAAEIEVLTAATSQEAAAEREREAALIEAPSLRPLLAEFGEASAASLAMSR